MVGCCVLGCKSRSELKLANLTFHSFPSDPVLKNKWVQATGKINWEPTKYSKMCSLHFNDNAFTIKFKNKRINQNALPEKEIFMPNDMENYMKYKVQGYVKQIRMKKGCLPSKFHCQDRISLPPKISPTDDVIKRQQLIEEAVREYEANITGQSASDSESFEKPSGGNGTLRQDDGGNVAKDSYVRPILEEQEQIMVAEWSAADSNLNLEELDGNMMEIKTEEDDQNDPLIKEEPIDINEHPPETELLNYAALYFKIKDEMTNLKAENQRLVDENHRLSSKLHGFTNRVENLQQKHKSHETISNQKYLQNLENIVITFKENNRRLAEQNKSLAKNIDKLAKQNHLQMKEIQDLTLINSNLSSKINELSDSNQSLTKTIERLTRDYARSIHGDLSNLRLTGVIKTLSTDNVRRLNDRKLTVDIERLTKDKAKIIGGDLNNSRLEGTIVKLTRDNVKSIDKDLNNSRLEGTLENLTRDNAKSIDEDLRNHKLTGVIEMLPTDNVKGIDRDVNNCRLTVTIKRLTTNKAKSKDGDLNVSMQEESDDDVQELTDKQTDIMEHDKLMKRTRKRKRKT